MPKEEVPREPKSDDKGVYGMKEEKAVGIKPPEEVVKEDGKSKEKSQKDINTKQV